MNSCCFLNVFNNVMLYCIEIGGFKLNLVDFVVFGVLRFIKFFDIGRDMLVFIKI